MFDIGRYGVVSSSKRRVSRGVWNLKLFLLVEHLSHAATFMRALDDLA